MPKDILINLAYECIIFEANSWPSLGLVSKNNSGSHHDMDIKTFILSANVFKKYFENIKKNYLKINTFQDLKKIGQIYEAQMFNETQNINTHKGLIFAFGIYFYFALKAQKEQLPYNKWPKKIKIFVKPLKQELVAKTSQQTNGQKLFSINKIKGARNTALTGYKIINKGINFLQKVATSQPKLSQENLSFVLLLFYFQKIQDTTVISKIGLKKYYLWKKKLKILLKKIKKNYHEHIYEILITNSNAIQEKVSPGGCADLVALTWFIYFCLKDNLF